jgi:hypothetical protein
VYHIKVQTHDVTLLTMMKLLLVSTFKIVVSNDARNVAEVGSSSTSVTSRAISHCVSAPLLQFVHILYKTTSMI